MASKITGEIFKQIKSNVEKSDNEYNNKAELVKSSDECQLLDTKNRYMVNCNNKWFNAQIIDNKYINKRRGVEYFVHYEGYSRHMDQWVPRKRIKLMETEKYFESVQPIEDNNLSPRRKSRDLTNSQLKRYKKNKPLITKLNTLKYIQIGKFEISTCYASAYPGNYGKQPKLYICEYCLQYMQNEQNLILHMEQCLPRQPPGKEIYRKRQLSIFEIDGDANKIYCQNLCLLCKLFLEQKIVFFEVSSFLFYILCKIDASGAHIIGYFSKEKSPLARYNLSCILILPPYQKRGFGKLLIDFSYKLSQIENKIGSPEKPLSDLGKLCYHSYWSWTLLEILKDESVDFVIENLSQMTSIAEIDIIITLRKLKMLKFWKDELIIYRKKTLIEQWFAANIFKRPVHRIDRSRIKWTPANH